MQCRRLIIAVRDSARRFTSNSSNTRCSVISGSLLITPGIREPVVGKHFLKLFWWRLSERRKLHLFVTRRRYGLKRSLRIGVHIFANGVELQADRQNATDSPS